MVLSGSVIPQVRWLRDLRQRTVEPQRLALDPGCAAILETDDLRDAVSILRRRGARAPFEALSALSPAVAPLAPSGERFEITGARIFAARRTGCSRASSRTPRVSCRGTSRRRISLAVEPASRLDAGHAQRDDARQRRPSASWARRSFSLARPGVELVGALLVLSHSILDGCDGELARLKFQESRFGGVLDFWGDNVVHAALFAAIAAGWSRAAGAELAAALGRRRRRRDAPLRGLRLPAHDGAGPRKGPLFTSVSPRAEIAPSRASPTPWRGATSSICSCYCPRFGKAHWFLALAAVGLADLLPPPARHRRRRAARQAAKARQRGLEPPVNNWRARSLHE